MHVDDRAAHILGIELAEALLEATTPTIDPNPAPNNTATASVTVQTAPQGTTSLIVTINASTAASSYKTVFVGMLNSVNTYLGLNTAYGNLAACNTLNSFKTLVTTYSTIPSTGITLAMANDWKAQVDLIRATIPC